MNAGITLVLFFFIVLALIFVIAVIHEKPIIDELKDLEREEQSLLSQIAEVQEKIAKVHETIANFERGQLL
jgi:hypothetical protein